MKGKNVSLRIDQKYVSTSELGLYALYRCFVSICFRENTKEEKKYDFSCYRNYV